MWMLDGERLCKMRAKKNRWGRATKEKHFRYLATLWLVIKLTMGKFNLRQWPQHILIVTHVTIQQTQNKMSLADWDRGAPINNKKNLAIISMLYTKGVSNMFLVYGCFDVSAQSLQGAFFLSALFNCFTLSLIYVKHFVTLVFQIDISKG